MKAESRSKEEPSDGNPGIPHLPSGKRKSPKRFQCDGRRYRGGSGESSPRRGTRAESRGRNPTGGAPRTRGTAGGTERGPCPAALPPPERGGRGPRAPRTPPGTAASPPGPSRPLGRTWAGSGAGRRHRPAPAGWEEGGRRPPAAAGESRLAEEERGRTGSRGKGVRHGVASPQRRRRQEPGSGVVTGEGGGGHGAIPQRDSPTCAPAPPLLSVHPLALPRPPPPPPRCAPPPAALSPPRWPQGPPLARTDVSAHQ
ncbi:collagen alpha-1(I) chain-like [Ammospiza caudacuta]|uniref:collagen alpha-1(I) chain-like n=1 Tax=Ammospiza caudacuta TaxID=2857398 RepID=UPI00273858A4|nr:collagen alpha-1(I) chain-like [Ammospiza caudacuta]